MMVLMVGCLEEDDGRDKLKESFNDGDLEQQIFNYEERFSQNDYAGHIKADSQEHFIEGSGDLDVLISAPHTTSVFREGSMRDAEVHTGSIALLIQAYTGAHLIYNVHAGEDANHSMEGNYKEKIGEIIEAYDIDLVIDLHGAGESRDFDIEIGTNHGQTVKDGWLNRLKSTLASHDIYAVDQDKHFSASEGKTITNYTYNQYQTKAMQVEIHHDYRNPREDLESYYKMLRSLVVFVETFDPTVDHPTSK